MATEIDKAFQRLAGIEASLRAQLKQPLNESDTRFQILSDSRQYVPEWPREEIQTEPPVADGYIDYCLSFSRRPALVIEAKRNGLLSPTTASTKVSPLKLSGSVFHNLRPAIEQARLRLRQECRHSGRDGWKLLAVFPG